MTYRIAAHSEGATIAVRAQPGARKNAILGEHDGSLKVAVTAPPEDGKANDAIIDLLRKLWSLSRSQFEIISGRSTRNKVLLVRGITPERLAGLVDGPESD